MAASTLLPGRGWFANALAHALLAALCPPLLLSLSFVLPLVLASVLALFFLLFLTIGLPLFVFLLLILITALVKYTERKIIKNYKPGFKAVVSCLEDTNETNQKAAVSLPVTLSTDGCILTFDHSRTSDPLTVENLSDVLAEPKDLKEGTDESDWSCDWSSNTSGSILGENEEYVMRAMNIENTRSPFLEWYGEEWSNSISDWLDSQEKLDSQGSRKGRKMINNEYGLGGLEIIVEEEED
jgi:hypothetical protein